MLTASSGVEIERGKTIRLSALDPLKSVSSFVTVEFEPVPFRIEEIDTLSDEVINSRSDRHVMRFQLSVTVLQRGKVFHL